MAKKTKANHNKKFSTRIRGNKLFFSTKHEPKEFSFLLNDTIGLSGTMVSVTYTLEKSSDVGEMNLSIGGTQINLAKDADPDDDNKFSSTKPYACLKEADGLQVILRSTGKAGGSWSMTISVNGNALDDSPISATTDGNGRLNHNEKHN